VKSYGGTGRRTAGSGGELPLRPEERKCGLQQKRAGGGLKSAERSDVVYEMFSIEREVKINGWDWRVRKGRRKDGGSG
jgi:hypothetical protein